MLVRALKKARWITFWERLWPPLAAIATAIGLFLAVSWAGAWLSLPGERPQTSVAAVSVPAGSILVVRASCKVQFDVVTSSGVAEVPADQRPASPAGTDERRYVITDRGERTRQLGATRAQAERSAACSPI